MFNKFSGISFILLIIFLGFSLLRELYWFFDLFTHFHLFYSIALAILILIHLLKRKYKSSMVFVLLLLYPLHQTTEYYSFTPITASYSRENTIRILSANVEMTNSDFVSFRKLLKKMSPDIILLLETNETWVKKLVKIETEYPHSITLPRSDYFGISLYSKYPLTNSSIEYDKKSNLPALLTTIKHVNGQFQLIGLHLDWPLTSISTTRQKQQIDWLKNTLSSKKDNVIVVGDFNTTPWSINYKNISSGGILNANSGIALQGTWPSWLSYFSLPIDHFFYTNSITIKNYQISDDYGSDHRAIIVDFLIE